jgi:ankyrin repeat protein
MDRSTALCEAIKRGDAASVTQLVQQDPSLITVQSELLSPVMLAMYYNQPAIATILVETGAKLDIFEAAAYGAYNQAATLLASDPSLANAVARDGFQPLGLAAFFGHTDVAQLLLAHGAEVNAASQNDQMVMPLHSAAAGQHPELARMLLAAGADVNARQESGFTPLHSAAQNGHTELVQVLLDAGADATLRTIHGKSAGDVAREYQRQHVVALIEG